MRACGRSWWLRQGVIVVVAEILGYLLSIELRDRYPQELCFAGVFFVISAIDDWRDRRYARRAAPNAAVIPLRPPGA
jgi:hypothetical protein